MAPRPGPIAIASARPKLAAAVETPQYDLTWFRVTFGRLGLKAYTKGERVLRVEATVHNTADLGCGRVLEKLPEITARLAAMAERFCTFLDCASVGALCDETLERLPAPSQIGRTRVGGINLDQARTRAALAAVAALSVAPNGFTVADLATKVHTMTGQTGVDYSIRQAAYDLRKLRGKELVVKPGRSRRYYVPPDAARTITAISVLRDRVIAPIVAGARSPRMGRKPKDWTTLDRHYETLRVGMHALFDELGIAVAA